jgi:hypothetical protein
MSVSVRDWLDAALVPLLPSGWRVIKNQRMPETLSQTTVIIKHLAIKKLADAPANHLSNEVTLTIVDHHTDQDLAENTLDEAVLTLVTALDSLPSLMFTGAKKVFASDLYLGWDIELTIYSRKD